MRSEQVISDEGIVQNAIKSIKNKHPELIVITDVCLCEYTSHGHCGVIKTARGPERFTLELLAEKRFLTLKQVPTWWRPSDMMDGRVGTIRHILDSEGYHDTPIMAYAAKYASSFYYGPFREAAESTPQLETAVRIRWTPLTAEKRCVKLLWTSKKVQIS